MTLNSRNRIIKISLAIVIFYIVSVVAALLLLFFFGNKPELPDFSYIWGIAGISYVAIFVPVSLFSIFFHFEKTHSPEIFYFAAFVAGSFCELFRILIFLFNLWDGYSVFLNYIGRAVYSGRVFSLLAFLFAMLSNEETQVQDCDKTLLVVLGVSLLFSAIVPLNTGTVKTYAMISIGYNRTFTIIVILSSITALVSGLIYKKGKRAFAFLTLYSGYWLLVYSDSPVLLGLGIILLSGGTALYLRALHSYYLWQ